MDAEAKSASDAGGARSAGNATPGVCPPRSPGAVVTQATPAQRGHGITRIHAPSDDELRSAAARHSGGGYGSAASSHGTPWSGATTGSGKRVRTPMSPTDSLLSPVSRRLAARLGSSSKRQRIAHPSSEERARRLQHPTSWHPTRVRESMVSSVDIVLGTSSEIRHKIMRSMGLRFRVSKPDIDEKRVQHADPRRLPVAVATAKAEALLQVVPPSCKFLITADQVVLIDGVPHGKPASVDEAKALMGRFHSAPLQSVAAVVVVNTEDFTFHAGADVVDIEFKPIPEAAMEAAIDGGRGDVMWCCGALCIEHKAIEPHVKAMHGSMDSVLGLPKQLLARLLRAAGYKGTILTGS